MSIFVFSHFLDIPKLIVEKTQYFDIYYHMKSDDVLGMISFETKLSTARLMTKRRPQELDTNTTLRNIHHFFRQLYLDLRDIKRSSEVIDGSVALDHTCLKTIGYSFETDKYTIIQNLTDDKPRIAIYPAGTPVDVEFKWGYHNLGDTRHNIRDDWGDLFFIVGNPIHREESLDVDCCSDRALSMMDDRCVVDLSSLNLRLSDLVLSTGERISV